MKCPLDHIEDKYTIIAVRELRERRGERVDREDRGKEEGGEKERERRRDR